MPAGELSVTNQPIPVFAPPYTTEANSFTDVSILTVPYRTSLQDVRGFVPDCLELDDEPLITAVLVSYGMSTVGSYNEYVHQVEVRYRGTRFDYPLSLILDNESAIFSGREQFGYPKTFGAVTLDRQTGSNTLLGHVHKPDGFPRVTLGFTPAKRCDEAALPPAAHKLTLNLRVIPSPVPGAAPSVKELVPVRMEIAGGDVWLGTGFIAFPNAYEPHPLHRIRVLRYEQSVYIRGASAVLHPPETTYDLRG